MAFEIGDKVDGYEVIGVLGVGGMGKVYKVRNLMTHRVEAMKVVLSSLAGDPSLADRFVREIKVLASLNHPRIAALYNALRVENQLMMIMEFVEGVTLDDLSMLSPIGLRDCINYICQVLAGLGYAHGKGVIHRDIKPGNMMLTAEGFIKIMDFGIAKSSTDAKLTMTGTTIGSPYYMPPEQVMGLKVDARSDLYSVGISLYKLVTGVHPFRDDSIYNVMRAHVQQVPTPPSLVAPHIPPALNDIILRALEKDPATRFQRAEEFRAALLGVLNELNNVPATDKLGTSGTLSQPAEASVLSQACTPSPATPSSAPDKVLDWLQPAEPITSRRILYFVVGGMLAAALIVTSAIELPRFYANRRREPRTASAETALKETNKLLPHFLPLSSGDMVLVEGGEALLGKDRQPVNVPSFYIDRTEVTNRDYLTFCSATNYAVPKGVEKALPDYPVVNVTFHDAQKFAEWAKKRLPSASEWEKAARWTDGRIYPWGNDLCFNCANIPWTKKDEKRAKLGSATAYSEGESPYHALNMLGNVWEWVDTPAEAPAGTEFKEYRRIFKDLSPALSREEPFYEVRGWSYAVTPDDPSRLIWDFAPIPARARKPDIGFRCAKDANP
jgi:serine/threonine-protein kinase